MALVRETDGFFTCRIRDTAFKQAGIGFAWGNGNSLLVYPQLKEGRPVKGDTVGSKERGGGCLHDVRWSTLLFSPAMRKLINESCGVFLELQKIASQNKVTGPQLLKISRSYRAILNVCWETRSEDEDAMDDEGQTGEQQAEGELLRRVEHLWHLCEILFLDTRPGTGLLTQLQQWARSYSSDSVGHRVRELLEEEDPHLSPNYWDLVTILLGQGSLEEARKLLHSHPDSAREDFVAMDELLQSVPQVTSLRP